ncbi:ABC transporter permease [Glutamicibacter sp.]|jgi:ABC-type nitrate/sulfonate/bicarbonate transport system, permease component|uniref:ABC transporter permease n=1 Tax=Glutamicibacter sp. TaxID=1931995 RepID=UPI002B46448D|nr:ABC transporter permease [Glutamicibacter sp.]HJX78352.1 ABC transporter permease [Glutamicibacter sp.]
MSAGTWGMALGKAVKTRQRRLRMNHSLLGLGTVLFALLLWEFAAKTGILPAVAFPPASAVLAALGQLVIGTGFWMALGATLSGAGVGLLIVVALALPLGLAIGRLQAVAKSTTLVIEFLKPIPPVALLPLALLFWGPSPTMKIFLVVMGALWPLLVQVIYGARGVEKTQLDLSRSYRLGWVRTVRHILLPTLLPHALVGLRVSASIAIVVAVVAELIGGAPGLGQDIALAQNSADLPKMYALIMATGLLGLAINGLFSLISKPLLFWHPSVRTKEN